MSNSKLVTYTKLSPNHSGRKTHKIDTITIHCTAGNATAKSILNLPWFTNAGHKNACSCNYAVGMDGSIGLCVAEENRSWCSSSPSNDNRAVTIEVSSSHVHPYAVNDKAYAALLDLVTDICHRNGIKRLVWSDKKSDRVNHANGCNMTVHCDYAAKACPGKYLLDRHGEIAAEVNRRLEAETTAAPPEPAAIKVGGIVEFTGNCHYSSANGSTSFPCKPGKARVTKIASGKHPYHLIHTGAGCTVYGWVDEKDVK